MVFEDAPPGWRTVTEIARVLDVSYQSVCNKIKTLGLEGKEFRSVPARTALHYSPEYTSVIVEALRKSVRTGVNAAKEPPPDYVSLQQLAKYYGITWRLAKKYIDKLKHHSPSAYNKCVAIRPGKIREVYFGPAIVLELNKIDDGILVTKPAPIGWMTSNDIANELSISRAFVKRKIVRMDNLEAAEYKDRMGRVYLYYSPEAVRLIHKELVKHVTTESAPDGWRTVGAMAGELGINRHTVHKVADSISEVHKKHFKCKTGGPLYLYYSPEAAKQVKAHLEQRRIVKDDK